MTHHRAPQLLGALTTIGRQERPVAYYAVHTHNADHWLVRHSEAGQLWISPYVDRGIAEQTASHLNTLVRWEAQ